MDNVDGDIPMTDEWVDFAYEVFWYVLKCRPVAGCRWSIWNVEDVHGLVMGEGLERRWLCVWNSSRIPLLMCQNLIVLSLLVLIVGQVVKELVVEFSRFPNELSLWDSQHQSVHFFIEFSVLIKHQGCHTEHHSDGHTDCYCN